jgi:DNA-binding response OmpR family regulator
MKVLVVEDDREIVKHVEDTLLALGYEHDWADNQQDAQRFLQEKSYDLMLLDLQIPARPNRGFAKIEHGRSLLESTQRIKGKNRLPVIIMTGYGAQALDQSVELLAAGAADFISKPFPESGRTLAKVIQDVLAGHRRKFPDAPAAANQQPKPEPFPGGTLAFYPDHIELLGETIIEKTHRGHAWKVLHLLKDRNSRGNYVRFSGDHLARTIQRGLGQNTIAQCVAALRMRITETMRDRQSLVCGKYDVIDNHGGGYHLSAKIVVEVHDTPDPAAGDGEEASVTEAAAASPVPSATTGKGNNGPLNERQKWVLAELTKGVELRRADVEKQFRVCPRTVKRDLADLAERGLIEFVETPRPGYYRVTG